MANKLNIYTHKDCFLHVQDEDHPESPMRLEKVMDKLKSISEAVFVEASLATDEQILLFHTKDYLERLNSLLPKEQGVSISIDDDTMICSDSLKAARRAVGAVCQATEDVLNGNVRRAFCAIRPPGHHALPDTSMGFCVFGNVAVAAVYALQNGAKRVAVVDFDVHHGNGTQKLAEVNPDVLAISLHQCPLWPWSGERNERMEENILNIPLALHTPAVDYLRMFENEVLPKLAEFKPDIIFVSAGFDAHLEDPPKEKVLLNDPPGHQCLEDKDYASLAQMLCKSADELCEGRLVAALEGGYNTDVLAKSCYSFVKKLV